MIDETTDIATSSSLIIYVYLISDSVGKIRYLADIQLSQCDANAIVAAISKFLEEDYGVKINKWFGFGYDGASVMTGRENGVAAILKKENPYLIEIRCAAHRLALASSPPATVLYCTSGDKTVLQISFPLDHFLISVSNSIPII